MTLKHYLLLLTGFICYKSWGQQAPAKTREEMVQMFCKSWRLNELKYQSQRIRTNRVKYQVIRFTSDSVFIKTSETSYTGTWNLLNDNLNIHIPGHPELDYALQGISMNGLCLENRTNANIVECYKKSR